MSELNVTIRALFDNEEIRNNIFELFNNFDSEKESKNGFKRCIELAKKYGYKHHNLFSNNPISPPAELKEAIDSGMSWTPSWRIDEIKHQGEYNLEMQFHSGMLSGFEILAKVFYLIDKAGAEGAMCIGLNDYTGNHFFGTAGSKGKLKICYESGIEGDYDDLFTKNSTDALDGFYELWEKGIFTKYQKYAAYFVFALMVPFLIIIQFIKFPFRLLKKK